MPRAIATDCVRSQSSPTSNRREEVRRHGDTQEDAAPESLASSSLRSFSRGRFLAVGSWLGRRVSSAFGITASLCQVPAIGGPSFDECPDVVGSRQDGTRQDDEGENLATMRPPVDVPTTLLQSQAWRWSPKSNQWLSDGQPRPIRPRSGTATLLPLAPALPRQERLGATRTGLGGNAQIRVAVGAQARLSSDSPETHVPQAGSPRAFRALSHAGRDSPASDRTPMFRSVRAKSCGRCSQLEPGLGWHASGTGRHALLNIARAEE